MPAHRDEANRTDGVRRLAAAARDEVEGPGELLGLVDGVDAKGVVEGDYARRCNKWMV